MAINKSVSDKSLTVLNFLKEHDGENLTSGDISAGLGGEDAGFSKRSVDGVITSGLIRNKNYVVRVPAEIELEDGTHKEVKFIQLTDAGRAYDHEAAKAADEAAKAAEKGE